MTARDTCTILEGYICADCGWPLIDACCNDAMHDLHPDEDYWMYCTNQGCKNHAGEGFLQGYPEWVKPEGKEET